jgi:hypothetical protein
VDQLPVAVDQAEAGNWPTPTVQEAGKIGNQANHGQTALSNHPALRGEVTREKFEKGKHGPPDQGNHSTHGSRPELLSDAWPTPTALSRVRNEETMEKCLKFRQSNGQTTVPLYLEERVNIEEKNRPESWATPQTRDWKEGSNPKPHGLQQIQLPQQAGAGKLNSRWVETLMGIPIGWTMPSCTQPIVSPASFVMTSSVGNAGSTTQTAHALGQIATTVENRTDELRLLGNGVVPACAEKALKTLWNQLNENT